MLQLETKADLERLITDEVKESLTLDYKESDALGKDSKQRDDLCKDVTAFANSAGGQIVYGVGEDKNLPIKVDDGADPAITKEWIEQVYRCGGVYRSIMLVPAFVILAVVVLLGCVLTDLHSRTGDRTEWHWPLATLHGLFAVAGLECLVLALVRSPRVDQRETR
jgi:hypothetical protein